MFTVRVMTATGPDAQGGMAAFGDALLFFAVFGSVALLPTGLGLVLLRRYPRAWTVLAAAGAGVALTGLAALVLFLGGREAPTSSTIGMWGAFAVLRILPAPLLALAFLIAAVASPQRLARWILVAGCVIELVVCAAAAYTWLPALLDR